MKWGLCRSEKLTSSPSESLGSWFWVFAMIPPSAPQTPFPKLSLTYCPQVTFHWTLAYTPLWTPSLAVLDLINSPILDQIPPPNSPGLPHALLHITPVPASPSSSYTLSPWNLFSPRQILTSVEPNPKIVFFFDSSDLWPLSPWDPLILIHTSPFSPSQMHCRSSLCLGVTPKPGSHRPRS